MLDIHYHPIINGFASVKADEVEIIVLDEIFIFKEDLDSLEFILKNSNGINTVFDIIDGSKNKKKTKYLINYLFDKGLLINNEQKFYGMVDSFFADNYFIDPHKKTKIINKRSDSNFKPFNKITSNKYNTFFKKTLKNRFSCRNFNKTKFNVNVSDLLCVLTDHQNYPSGGSIYDIKLYAVFLYDFKVDNKNYKKGLYLYSNVDRRLKFIKDVNINKMSHLMDSKICENASAIFLFSSDFKKSSRKYLNKSLQLNLLECGHMVQNLYIHASINNFGVVEYGGYNESGIKEFFGIKDNVLTSAIVGGIEDKSCKSDLDEILKKLDSRVLSFLESENFVLSGKQVGMYCMTGYSKDLKVSAGVGELSEIAEIKTIAESYERFFTTFENSDKSKFHSPTDGSKVLKLENFIHNKNILTKLTPSGRCMTGVCVNSGKSVSIPIELLFIKEDCEECDYFGTTTNGCAANVDLKSAEKSAVLELIERDAFVYMWCNKVKPKLISKKNISKENLEKIKRMKQLGAVVDVVDITREYGNVVLTRIYSIGENVNYVGFGLSCALDINTAIEKSLDEAISGYVHLVSKYNDSKESASNLSDYTDMEDLFDLTRNYMNKSKFKKIDWVFNNLKYTNDLNTIERTDFDLIVKNLNLYKVILKTPGKKNPFYIVRVLSDDLLPIYFSSDFIPIDHNLLVKNYNKDLHFFS